MPTRKSFINLNSQKNEEFKIFLLLFLFPFISSFAYYHLSKFDNIFISILPLIFQIIIYVVIYFNFENKNELGIIYIVSIFLIYPNLKFIMNNGFDMPISSIIFYILILIGIFYLYKSILNPIKEFNIKFHKKKSQLKKVEILEDKDNKLLINKKNKFQYICKDDIKEIELIEENKK